MGLSRINSKIRPWALPKSILKPGEIETVVLEFDVDRDANPKEYLSKLLVRSTGDTEKGDTNVYTQELKASVNVEKGMATQSKNLWYALSIFGIILVVGLIYRQGESGK